MATAAAAAATAATAFRNIQNTLCHVKKMRYTLTYNLISAAMQESCHVIVRVRRSNVVGCSRELCNAARLRDTRDSPHTSPQLMDYLIRNE